MNHKSYFNLAVLIDSQQEPESVKGSAFWNLRTAISVSVKQLKDLVTENWIHAAIDKEDRSFRQLFERFLRIPSPDFSFPSQNCRIASEFEQIFLRHIMSQYDAIVERLNDQPDFVNKIINMKPALFMLIIRKLGRLSVIRGCSALNETNLEGDERQLNFSADEDRITIWRNQPSLTKDQKKSSWVICCRSAIPGIQKQDRLKSLGLLRMLLASEALRVERGSLLKCKVEMPETIIIEKLLDCMESEDWRDIEDEFFSEDMGACLNEFTNKLFCKESSLL